MCFLWRSEVLCTGLFGEGGGCGKALEKKVLFSVNFWKSFGKTKLRFQNVVDKTFTQPVDKNVEKSKTLHFSRREVQNSLFDVL